MSGACRPGAAALIAALAGLLLASCDKPDDETTPVRPVLSLLAEPTTQQVFGPFTGTVQPRYKTDAGFRASGRMVSRDVNVGDLVKKGDLLASLDPTVAQLSLVSSKADLANAQAQLVNALATAQRKATLLQTGSAPQADVDSAVASKDTAQAKVNQAQASLVKAKEQVAYTELHSEFDGVITNWAVEVGQVVTVGQTVVTIARPDVRDGVFDVPDDLLDKVRPGAQFTVSLQVDPAVTVLGSVREIAPQSDDSTKTRRVRLTLADDAPEGFRLGTTVTITLTKDQAPTFPLPSSAILEKDGKASVWLVSDGKTVANRPVVLQARDGNVVIVKDGLAKGDRVVTAGVHSLSEGQPIKLEP